MYYAIYLKNISKLYRIPSIKPWKKTRKIEALKDVTFTCPEGKITCLLGPNGAGKTSIIKILAGLVLPDKGDIEIIPENNRTDIKQKVKIGFATPNERSFYWRLTGRQNMEFFAALHGLKGREKKEKVSDILSEMDLEKDADKLFGLYSTGMKQKLLLARAILGDPEILLLDEPTSHLDPLARNVIHSIISNSLVAKRGTTILLCTHDLLEAQKLADHIVLLNDGKVIAEGDLAALRNRLHATGRVIMEFSRMPKKKWYSELPVEVITKDEKKIVLSVPDSDTISSLIEAAVSAKGRIIQCSQYQESLMDIFTRLTSESI